jgi:hypothetical protein
VAELLRIDRRSIVDAQWSRQRSRLDRGDACLRRVLAVRSCQHHSRRIDIGIVGPHPAGSDAAFEIRAIFSDAHSALIETPVCGSLNASVRAMAVR